MIIQNVRLRNFGNFEDHTVEFSPRTNLFVGAMGSGKSTILNAIKFGLTGDTEGNRESNVRQKMPEGEQSFVELHLTHAGSSFRIKRSLSSSSASLEIDGEKFGRKKAEINEELWGRLETDKQKISKYIFAAQEDVKGVLDETASNRKKEFASLFGLAAAAHIHSKVQEYLTKVEVPLVNPTEGDDLQKEHTQIVEELTAAKNTLSVLQETYKHAEHAATAKNLTDVVRALDIRERILPDFNSKKTELETTQKELNAAVTARDEYAKDIDLLRGDLPASRDAVVKWQEYNAHKVITDSLEADIQKIDEQIANLILPEVTLTEDELLAAKNLATTLSQHQAERASYGEATNNDACPACGISGGDIEARINTLDSEIEKLAPTVAVNAEVIAALDNYKNNCKTLSENKQRLSTQLASYADVTMPTLPEDEAKQLIEDFALLESAFKDKVSDIKNYEVKIVSLQERITQLEVDVSFADKVFSNNAEHANLNKFAVQALQKELDNNFRKHTDLLIEIGKLNGRFVANENSLKRYASRAAQAAHVVSAKDCLQRVREILSSDEAPRMVSCTYLQELEEDINALLAQFSAPFRVRVDVDSLEFIASFLDNTREHSASRLSVGQRIMLAISFRMAVNLKFSSSLGLLVMDEPTTGLDEDALACLPDIFAWFKNVTAARGLQLVMVTHEPRVEPVFDKVIRVA